MVALLANDQCQLSNRAAIWWQMFSWQHEPLVLVGALSLDSKHQCPMPAPFKTSLQINSNKHPGPPLTPFQLTLGTVGLSGLLLQPLPGQLKHPDLASGLSSPGATRPALPATTHSRISSSSFTRGAKGAFKQAIYHSRHNLSKRNKNSPCLRQTTKACM